MNKLTYPLKGRNRRNSIRKKEKNIFFFKTHRNVADQKNYKSDVDTELADAEFLNKKVFKHQCLGLSSLFFMTFSVQISGRIRIQIITTDPGNYYGSARILVRNTGRCFARL